MGAAVALVGQAVRLWAAGHLEKSREVTTSGPYQFTRHPLYVGSSIMALGVAVGCRSIVVGVLVGLYMATTITAAIRSEEAFLRERFGDAYDAYAESRGPRWLAGSAGNARGGTRRTRALTGLILFLAVLAARAFWA